MKFSINTISPFCNFLSCGLKSLMRGVKSDTVSISAMTGHANVMARDFTRSLNSLDSTCALRIMVCVSNQSTSSPGASSLALTTQNSPLRGPIPLIIPEIKNGGSNNIYFYRSIEPAKQDSHPIDVKLLFMSPKEKHTITGFS